MIEVLPCAADDQDEQRGLDIYNAVWPHDRVGLDEDRSYRASMRDYLHLLTRIAGTLGGTALGVISPQRPEVVFALVSVLVELLRGLARGDTRHPGAEDEQIEPFRGLARARHQRGTQRADPPPQPGVRLSTFDRQGLLEGRRTSTPSWWCRSIPVARSGSYPDFWPVRRSIQFDSIDE
jgi:hypothetical protein